MSDKELENLKGIITLSAQFLKFKPMFAYYLKTYACEKTHNIYKIKKQNGEDVSLLQETLKQWFSDCDQIKNSNPALFSNKQACQQEMTEYALKLFLKSDNEERDDTFTMDTVKNFKIVAGVLEALAVFGPVSPDLDKKRKYAKLQSVKVFKKLKDPNYVRKQQPNIDDEIAKLDAQLAAQQNMDDGNVADEGPIQKNPAYVSNFNANKQNFQSNNNNTNNFQQQNQFSQQQQFNNNFQQQQQQNQGFNPGFNNNNNNIQQQQQNQGFKSIFNQVPQVINKSTIQDQKQVANLLDTNDVVQQQQIQQQQQNIINQQQPNQLQQPIQPQQQQPSSRLTTKSGRPAGKVKAEIKKHCETAMSEISFKNKEKAIKELEACLQLFNEIV